MRITVYYDVIKFEENGKQNESTHFVSQGTDIFEETRGCYEHILLTVYIIHWCCFSTFMSDHDGPRLTGSVED